MPRLLVSLHVAVGVLALTAHAHARAPRFSSKTTSLARGCRPIDASIEGDAPVRCRAIAGHRVEMWFAAATTRIELGQRREVSLTTERIPGRIEWRHAGKKPFAVIVELVGDRGAGEVRTIAVRGLAGFETLHRDFALAEFPDAVRRARAYADAAYVEHLAGPPRLEPCGATAAPPLTSFVGLKVPASYWVDMAFEGGGWSPSKPIPASHPTAIDLRNQDAFPVLAQQRGAVVRVTVRLERAPLKSRIGAGPDWRWLYVAAIERLCAP
jgi:hypothetical protein